MPAGYQPASIARHGHRLVRVNQLPFRAASCRTEQASCRRQVVVRPQQHNDNQEIETEMKYWLHGAKVGDSFQQWKETESRKEGYADAEQRTAK